MSYSYVHEIIPECKPTTSAEKLGVAVEMRQMSFTLMTSLAGVVGDDVIGVKPAAHAVSGNDVSR